MDRSFTDFKFNGKWASEFNLIAVSDGDRYTPPVFGTMNPNISSVPGKTGVYKWRTQFSEKVFNIKIAFDNLLQRDINRIKKWLAPKTVQQLFLNDEPYKFYWASLNGEPSFSFVPFVEKESVLVGGKVVEKGIFKGEASLQFVAIDNLGYSAYDNFSDVEVGPSLLYSASLDKDLIAAWIQTSNLLNKSNIYNNAKIYSKSLTYTDANGIGAAQPIYLLNQGTENARLNIKFDFIMPADGTPLVILIEGMKKNAANYVKQFDIVKFQLNYFGNYQPFLDMYDDVQADWQIEIDSMNCEVYLKHKTDTTKILNLSRFNEYQNFLELTSCDYIDYLKVFPTNINTTNNTAIMNTIFNKIYVQSVAQDYRLRNVELKWKHTYL